MTITWAGVRAALTEAAGLVLPLECAGCGAWDVRLCPPCTRAFSGEVRRVEQDAPRLASAAAHALPTWACAPYAGPVRDAVVAWKDGGRLDVTRDLAGVVRAAVRPLARPLAQAADGVLVVVPVPSGAAARRRRGADLTGALATAVAHGLADGGARAVVGRLLARTGGRDQVGLGSRARARNASGTWRVRSRLETGASHLLVDDVLTTGSTLAGCRTALSASGGLVLGAVVLAATPVPSQGTEVLPGPGPAG